MLSTIAYPPATRPLRQPLLLRAAPPDGLPRQRPQAREGGTEAVDLLGVPRPRLCAQ